MRRKAARLVAAKSALAARVDASHQSSDGRIGKNLREEIEKKLDKLQEPPPVKSIKALPKPVDPPKKRRGGKRVRKMKERYAVTEMRKQANRITFGDVNHSICFWFCLLTQILFVNVTRNNFNLDWGRCVPTRSWV